MFLALSSGGLDGHFSRGIYKSSGLSPVRFAMRASIREPMHQYRETRIQNPASQDGKVYGENRIIV
jgi:hypothetical protein